MAVRMDAVLRHLRKAALRSVEADLEDGRLLERFVSRRDEAAFETLVRRHGPMVLGVCRRILGNHHDVEDAFQATFLVLVHKAASLLGRETIGNWLYGVAYHTALKARAALARRRAKESQVRPLHRPTPLEEADRHEAYALLDHELRRLPDKYRAAVVLCDLQGSTRKEAAQQLGLPEGTLSTRLARARALLGKRLARHAATFSAGGVGILFGAHPASAYLPASLIIATIQAARFLDTGLGAAAGAVSARAIILKKGVLKEMFLMKLKSAMTVLLVVALATAGGGLLVHRSVAREPQDSAAESASSSQAEQPRGAVERKDWAVQEQFIQYQVNCKIMQLDPNGQDLGGNLRGKILASPVLILPEGKEGTVHSGGQQAMPVDGGSAVEFLETGLFLRFKVTALKAGRMRLDAVLEKTDLSRVDAQGAHLQSKAVRSIVRVGLGEEIQLMDKDDQGKAQHCARLAIVDEQLIVSHRRSTGLDSDIKTGGTTPAVHVPTAGNARDEALALLSTARRLLAQGKLDEAERLAARVRRREVHWGLFEDSPDKLLRDVSRARQDNSGAVSQHGSNEEVHLSKPRPADGEPGVCQIFSREMKIPVLVTSERRAELKYVALLVSADRGKTWETAATISPDEDAFSFRAPRDGLYWLTVQSVRLDDTKEPNDLRRTLRPMLKISVKSGEAKGH